MHKVPWFDHEVVISLFINVAFKLLVSTAAVMLAYPPPPSGGMLWPAYQVLWSTLSCKQEASEEMTLQELPNCKKKYSFTILIHPTPFPPHFKISSVVLGKTPAILTLVRQAWIKDCTGKYFMFGSWPIKLWQRAIYVPSFCSSTFLLHIIQSLA